MCIFFPGWWLNSLDPIRQNPGLDHPSYKIQILWLDQAEISTHRCVGRIWARSRRGWMKGLRKNSKGRV